MSSAVLILGAVAAGWCVQLWLTYRQSMAFNDDVRALRRSGTVSVGSGGRRYRGGRAYVAVAVDERGVVRDAITLRGFTTFARSRPLPELRGAKVNQLRGERDFPGLSAPQRGAARQAATLLRQETTVARETAG